MALRQREKRQKRVVSAKKRADTHTSGFERTCFKLPDEGSVFNLKKPGTYRIDVIPYEVGKGNPYAEPGSLHFERTYFAHRGIGPDGNTYVCPKKTAGLKCPICEHRAKLASDPDSNEELIKDLAPKERQLFNIIDLKEPEKGVQIWDISHYLFGKLLDTKVKNADEGDNYEFFADIEKGSTLKITAEEKSFGGNSFREVADLEFKTRTKEYDDDILKESHNLDEALILLPYDKLKKIFLQTADASDDDEEEEDEDEPKPKKKKVKPPVDDEEEEEEDEPEEDSEVEEETAEDKGIEAGSTVTSKAHGICTIIKVSGDGLFVKLKNAKGKVINGFVSVQSLTLKEEAEEEEEEEPKPKAKKKKTPVEVDEDDEDEEEEAEEDEPPVKKKKKPPVDDDWDDNDEPEEDSDVEEDEPKPKKKKVKN